MWRKTTFVATFVVAAAVASAQSHAAQATSAATAGTSGRTTAQAASQSSATTYGPETYVNGYGRALADYSGTLAGTYAAGYAEAGQVIHGDMARLRELTTSANALAASVPGQVTYIGGSSDYQYDVGTRALEGGRYEAAVESFDRVISGNGSRVEGALYWKAYALNRLGKRSDALASLNELFKRYPSSRWTNDAKALQQDVQRATGQPVSPEQVADEELKVMALNALVQTDPKRALPMLQQILAGTDSPRIKDRALFVLAQSSSPEAREVLKRVAMGQGNPDAQLKAVRYLGIYNAKESRQVLAEVYAATSDADIKRQVLRAFASSGDRDRLLAAAKTESNASLRAEAVRQLGAIGARAELESLYTSVADLEMKQQLLQSLSNSGAYDRLLALAKAESDATLRRKAVQGLGTTSKAKTGDALVEIYLADKDVSVKKAAISALYSQQNATALISLARQERDFELKKEIVSRLSNIRSPEATEYMLELLKK